MATRIYVQAGATPPVSPGFAAWNDTFVTPSRTTMHRTKQSSAHALQIRSETTTLSTIHILLFQAVHSEQLAAQTITGNLRAQFYFSEANVDADFSYACVLKVVSGDGTTLRGTLFSNFPSSIGTEFAAGASGTSEANRSCPASSVMTDVTCSAGDRLVFELGYTTFNTHSTSRAGRVEIGDDQAADAPVNETDTAEDTNDGWLEISTNLTFQTGQTNKPPSMCLMGVQ